MILGIQARSSWGGPCENAVHRLHNYIILYVYNMSYMYIIFNMCTLLYEYLATSTLYYIYTLYILYTHMDMHICTGITYFILFQVSLGSTSSTFGRLEVPGEEDKSNESKDSPLATRLASSHGLTASAPLTCGSC